MDQNKGLYNSDFEHDNCGIGAIVNIKGKKKLIDEFNSLDIDGMSKINELYPLHGDFVNMEYELPNEKKVKFLDDNESYYGNQVECEFDNSRCFGLVGNAHFLLVCEYDEGGKNPELIIYKRR